MAKRKSTPVKSALSTRLQRVELELPSPELCVCLANSASPREKRGPQSRRTELGVVEQPLMGYDDLVDWMVRVRGLTDAEARELHDQADDVVAEAVEAYSRVLELRDVFVKMIAALVDGKDPVAADFQLVAAAVRERQPSVAIVTAGTALTWACGPSQLTLDWPRRQFLFSMAALLSSKARQDVRRCAARDCTVCFLVDGHSRKRRWCSMAACGNLSKVRRHSNR